MAKTPGIGREALERKRTLEREINVSGRGWQIPLCPSTVTANAPNAARVHCLCVCCCQVSRKLL